MPTFDPSVTEDTNGRSEVADIPSGDYLIRVVWFENRTSKKGNEFLSLLINVVSGEYTNKAFWSTLMCMTDGAAGAKWRLICKSLDITEKFEIGGQQGNDDFARLIKGRPLRARIMRKQLGDYVNHDIDKTYARNTWSESDEKAVKDLDDTMLGESNESNQMESSDDIPF